MVAAVAVTVLDGAVDKLDEVSKSLRSYKEIVESRDGSVRFWVTTYGGSEANRIVVVAEYDSSAAAGASLDQMRSTEIGTHAFQELEENGAVQFISRSLMIEWVP